jgi:uncharacterized alkaline shock family protein YloU
MAEFVYIQNYERNGNMGISHLVFDQIVAIATNQVNGANVADGESVYAKFKLHKPITCTIRNGIVNVKIFVTLTEDSDVDKVSNEIKENVTQTLLMTTEFIPFNIDVTVVGFTSKDKS